MLSLIAVGYYLVRSSVIKLLELSCAALSAIGSQLLFLIDTDYRRLPGFSNYKMTESCELKQLNTRGCQLLPSEM